MATTRTDRQTAAWHWLLAAAPSRTQAMNEWNEAGAAWLRPGVLFAAVTIPADVLHAAVGFDSPEDCMQSLAPVLESGPLFFSSTGFRREGSYTALLPASVALRREPLPGVVTLPQRALLMVPAPVVTAPTVQGAPWWVSPLVGPALLCPPQRVAALAALGRDLRSQSKGRHDG